MGAIVSQIASFTIVYSCVYSGADQRKHQSSSSLAFVLGIHRWPVNSPHKWPVTRKMFPFDDVIIMGVPIQIRLSIFLVNRDPGVARYSGHDSTGPTGPRGHSLDMKHIWHKHMDPVLEMLKHKCIVFTCILHFHASAKCHICKSSLLHGRTSFSEVYG